MVSTLITLTAGFLVALAVVWILDVNRRASRRRDRDIVRRLVRYMTVVEQSRRPW